MGLATSLSRRIGGKAGDRLLDEVAVRIVGPTRAVIDAVVDQRGARIAADADVFRLGRRESDVRAVERALVRDRARRSGAVGLASGLPGVIAGPGMAVEVAAAVADAVALTYAEVSVILAISHLRGRDIRDIASRRLDVLLVLGLYVGAVTRKGDVVTADDVKIDLARVEDLPDEVVGRITREIADRIVSRVAARRARTLVPRLIPFGVGVAVAGIDDFRSAGAVGREAIRYLDLVDSARSAPAA